MPDLSVIIPARNEEFLAITIDNVMDNARADTEVIAVADGCWPEPVVRDRPGVRLIHHTESIGQRAATNEAAKLSRAKYVMKLDAHCAVDEGFDVKLMEHCEPDWTVVPRMYALDAFHWVCRTCGKEYDQGPPRKTCDKCGPAEFERKLVWKKKNRKRTDYMWFDDTLRIRYFDKPNLAMFGDVADLKERCSHKKRDWARDDITDVMCCIGACWFQTRDRYWELGGLDEGHGSWGQVAVELACKAWLSGGRHVINKKTWFAHLSRTQKGFSWPYPMSHKAQEYARAYSRDMWLNDKWSKAVRPLSWLVDKFGPLPGWEKEHLAGVVYYTDGQCDDEILKASRASLSRSTEMPIVSVSTEPLDFGFNVVVREPKRSTRRMYQQILAGLEQLKTDVVFLAEHDVLYTPDHFEFQPPRQDTFYFNTNRWNVYADTGEARFYDSRTNSAMCCNRKLLLDWVRKRISRIDEEGAFRGRWGHSPGSPGDPEKPKFDTWQSEVPLVDIRHGRCTSGVRRHPSDFRTGAREMQVADGVPGWGQSKGRFREWLGKACGSVDFVGGGTTSTPG